MALRRVIHLTSKGLWKEKTRLPLVSVALAGGVEVGTGAD